MASGGAVARVCGIELAGADYAITIDASAGNTSADWLAINGATCGAAAVSSD